MCRYRTLLVSTFVLLAVISFGSRPASTADSCDPVFNALTKVLTTPSHSYSTQAVRSSNKTNDAETFKSARGAFAHFGVFTISKTNGLALRKEVDMDYGGRLGKMHLIARYEYGNVKPPM